MKNKTAYFLLGLVAISAFQIAAIVQPAMGQCIEPTQERTTSVIASIETIIADNSYHHLGNDIKEDLTPKEPEGITYTKTLFLDSGIVSKVNENESFVVIDAGEVNKYPHFANTINEIEKTGIERYDSGPVPREEWNALLDIIYQKCRSKGLSWGSCYVKINNSFHDIVFTEPMKVGR